VQKIGLNDLHDRVINTVEMVKCVIKNCKAKKSLKKEAKVQCIPQVIFCQFYETK
jgi:hypothetical protein